DDRPSAVALREGRAPSANGGAGQCVPRRPLLYRLPLAARPPAPRTGPARRRPRPRTGVRFRSPGPRLQAPCRLIPHGFPAFFPLPGRSGPAQIERGSRNGTPTREPGADEPARRSEGSRVVRRRPPPWTADARPRHRAGLADRRRVAIAPGPGREPARLPPRRRARRARLIAQDVAFPGPAQDALAPAPGA